MSYCLNDVESKKIIEYFGDEFYKKVLNYLEIYSEKWKLNILRLVDYYSINCIFLCRSEIYGDTVLKISDNTHEDFMSEYNVLREYNGKSFCKLFACDTENKVMLIQRIIPGVQLKAEPITKNRLAVFSSLYNKLHIKPTDPALYQRYIDKVNYYADYISNRGDCKDLYLHMTKAKNICGDIYALYNKEMLLHGDLNYTNILLRDDGKYVIIDPQGLLGDPVFDIPRYILTEYYDICKIKDLTYEQRFNRIDGIIEYLESSLNIPAKIIRQCFYIETVTFESWSASTGNYNINNVIFAENIMLRGQTIF